MGHNSSCSQNHTVSPNRLTHSFTHSLTHSPKVSHGEVKKKDSIEKSRFESRTWIFSSISLISPFPSFFSSLLPPPPPPSLFSFIHLIFQLFFPSFLSSSIFLSPSFLFSSTFFFSPHHEKLLVIFYYCITAWNPTPPPPPPPPPKEEEKKII